MDKEIQKEDLEEKDEKIQIRGGRRDYPLMNLDSALKVAHIVYEMQGNATKEDIEQGIKKKGGGLMKRIASARKWGLIDGIGKMSITPLAMDIIHPEEDGEEIIAKQKAYFNVPIFKKIYEIYSWNLPRKELLINVLIRQGIPKKDAKTLANLIYLNKQTLFNEGGESEAPKKESKKEFVKRIENIPSSSRLNKEIFNLLINIGKLEESIKNFKKESIQEILKEIFNFSKSIPLIDNQIKLLVSDINVLDEDSLKKIMPPRINSLIEMIRHELKIS